MWSSPCRRDGEVEKSALLGGYILSSLRKERLGEKGGAFLKGKEGRIGFQKRATKLHHRKVAQKNGRGIRSPVYLLFLILHPPEEVPSSEDWLT